MRLAAIGLVAITVMLSLGPARASAMQAPAPPEKPAAAKVDADVAPLTQAEQDQLTIAMLAKDNAEKALRLASVDYQKASENLDKAGQALQKPGTVLQQNPQTGKIERVKAPEKK